MDMISNLPDEIICHIVSFLSAKEAAFTTVLKKRFQNVFHIIPNLRFDDTVENQGTLTDYLDGVLALPLSTRVRKVSYKCRKGVDQTHYAQVKRFLCHVLSRGVFDLNICVEDKRYSLPFEVFTCKSIVKLKLGGDFVINVLPEDASLPALETLILDSVRFTDLRGCAFEAFLSACPVLKELIMHGIEWERWIWSGKVSSPTLQRLTILHGYLYQIDYSRITLDTPSLTYLYFSDAVPDEYPIVNLGSLVEARLDLMLAVDHICDGFVGDGDNITSNPTNLIKGLRNVKIMNLSSPFTLQVFYYFREAIPVFENLHHLTITPLDVGSCQLLLPFLVEKSPNLETLVIAGPLHYNEQRPESVCGCMLGYSFLLNCPVKVLKISEYSGTSGEVEQLNRFLEKLFCLEVVKLRCRPRSDDDEKTLMLPRASSKCKIKVEFPHA